MQCSLVLPGGAVPVAHMPTVLAGKKVLVSKVALLPGGLVCLVHNKLLQAKTEDDEKR